ncbi:mitochondrial inner membrane protease subunit 2 [Ricinus communis]|uniref:Mitochondrial inner membrane protease subunit 2 n=1 Tax=Ricinus communis TaxID=3988 RepID=B9SQ38_RICCO|nr:mitochondrial inner membrane protease subunit 2 [Ricinus communis]XP_015580224.1 mitochondrial inner membrane protease subunit 2 [Ricinus communis]XP_015580225.1 mitochondrial inner membrane protease subunit 2 [Ricinus communis]XP_025014725.1 mitochondrial inner membrane protease subunit 2 [Ricinus communis]EEF34285.1 mitochondrial inner membrane protease subunit, putative [Ricinus communis]|eukprot:XP_002528106.1 mitochondrial inner membrane protease subunit 2 [Ricinus communis]
MASSNFLWSLAKKYFTVGLIGITISDRYASIVPVRGVSMSPTFNPGTSTFWGSFIDDCVLVEKFCLEKYRFSHGDVVVFRSPSNHKEKHIKRIIGLPGDWIGTPHAYDVVKVPEGHCWVEGDNLLSSMDSRYFGPVPLGLISGRVTHIVWPPQRIGEVEKKIPQGRLSSS